MKKPTLKCKTETVITLDYGDLEAFVRKVYPHLRYYSFTRSEECGNDTMVEFEVPNRWASTDDDEQWESWKNVKKIEDINNHILFDRLLADGHIKAGTYIVRVCW